MLPPEPGVLIARRGFADAQLGMAQSSVALGFYQVGWYGTNLDDERGCFAVVNTTGPLLNLVGEFVRVDLKRRYVYVYCIGTQTTLTADIAVTRRAFLAISLLAKDPIRAKVSVVR